MAEYIELEAAFCLADYAADEHPYSKEPGKPEMYSDYNQGWNDACDYIRARLEEAPAADVPPIVRCRDCKHSCEELSGLVCKFGPCVECEVGEDFWCKCGEKKEGVKDAHTGGTADAGAVVRCCRCKFGEPLNDKSTLCYHTSTELDMGVKTFPNDFFCKYGESGMEDEHGD